VVQHPSHSFRISHAQANGGERTFPENHPLMSAEKVAKVVHCNEMNDVSVVLHSEVRELPWQAKASRSDECTGANVLRTAPGS
jgi:hypothetical protein